MHTIIYDDNDFDDFLLDITDVHDGISWLGWGQKQVSMASVATGTYDPIFYAHHCMIDRIWYLWQVGMDKTKVLNNMLDIPLAPFHLKCH